MKAWLVTNEYLNSNKYSKINAWLFEAAKKQDIQLEIKTNADLMVSLGYERKRQEDISFVLFWDKDIRLAMQLEELGYRLFNTASAIALCDDKSLTHIKLQNAGIRMPKTIIAPMTYPNIGYTNHDFVQTVVESLPFPIVVKECFGSFGMQVYKADNREELIGIVKKIGHQPMLFQEFIAYSAGKDVRIHVVGNEVVTSMYRYSDTGDFRANISNGGKMKPYEPTVEEKNIAIKCVDILGLDFAGVDLLFGEDGRPIVCEVNSNAHFRNIYDCTKVNVADYIMKDIRKKLQKG